MNDLIPPYHSLFTTGVLSREIPEAIQETVWQINWAVTQHLISPSLDFYFRKRKCMRVAQALIPCTTTRVAGGRGGGGIRQGVFGSTGRIITFAIIIVLEQSGDNLDFCGCIYALGGIYLFPTRAVKFHTVAGKCTVKRGI